MSISNDESIVATKSQLREGMIDFMDEDTLYNLSHVDKCMAILDRHITEVASLKTSDEYLGLVEQAVEALNELNDEVEGEMIETDQREDICGIIIRVGHLAGYNDEQEDLTEEWREF